MSLGQVDEMKKVHTFPISSIVSLAFLPHSTSESHCPLFVTYGKYPVTEKSPVTLRFYYDVLVHVMMKL